MPCFWIVKQIVPAVRFIDLQCTDQITSFTLIHNKKIGRKMFFNSVLAANQKPDNVTIVCYMMSLEIFPVY